MLKTSHLILALGVLMSPLPSSAAQVSFGFAAPGVSIGINLPAYPELDVVPGYPVYYAPRVDANYFFYDGTYWLYQNDNWYASSWYNGPWELVDPLSVPAFILRIPVRYYHHPPAYFRGWAYDAPPHWGEHWGRDWEQRRGGWDRWNHGAARTPAPLPAYQRLYSGDRYPRQVEQQRELNSQYYRFQPKHPLTRELQGPRGQSGPGPVHQGFPQQTNRWQQGPQRYNPPQPVQQVVPQQRNPRLQSPQRYSAPQSVQQSTPNAPHAQTPQREIGNLRRPGPPQGTVQSREQTPASRGGEERRQGKDAGHESRNGGQGERGRNHNEYAR